MEKEIFIFDDYFWDDLLNDGSMTFDFMTQKTKTLRPPSAIGF